LSPRLIEGQARGGAKFFSVPLCRPCFVAFSASSAAPREK
jgi:hypothetical protein